MRDSPIAFEEPQADIAPRDLAERAFSRAAGAPLVAGNRARLLRDAKENYPAWTEAIQGAKRSIHFETYMLHDDAIGKEFADLFERKAKEGVRVRLILDWVGVRGTRWSRMWKSLRAAGVELRWFNPPQLDSPLSWLSRDHRKLIVVDGDVGFVSGLCIGQDWAGYPERGVEPWRDTGLQIEGPAVAGLAQAFAMMWAAAGSPLPPEDAPSVTDRRATAGDVALRVVAGVPNAAGLYRLDQLIAALAREYIWLTDAYFVGTSPYVQALRAAAMDGVDVRLLVPRTSDVPLIRAMSRAGYRPLLEAGIRVFEWDGAMLHAKTAVADRKWTRVGSTNLNVASWIGNWELDVVVEDEQFSQAMEDMFLEDLEHSTEIVLSPRHKVRLAAPDGRAVSRPRRRRGGGSAGRTAAGVLRIGNAVTAAITNRRTLGPAESVVMLYGGLLLLALAVIAALWPWLMAIPLVVLGVWFAFALLLRAYRLRSNKDI